MVFGTLKNKAKSFLGQYEQKDPATFAAAQQAIGGLLILDGFTGIDNPFEGKKRPGIFGSLIGIVVGIVFIFVPNSFGGITGANNMTATTNAVVVSMTPERSTSQRSASQNSGTVCSLIVRYTVAGKEYTQPSSISSGGNCALTAGQTIPINYNPQNPGSWVYNLKSITMFLSIFFWAGLLLAITSFITFIIRLLSIIYGWKLLQQGRTLAKSLPQGVSLGGLIEEIKQNFTGVVFNRGAAGAPMIPGLSFMQASSQAQAVPNPIQQGVVGPSAPISPPQPVTNLDNPFMQPTQTPAQTVSVPVLTSPPESATVNPTSDPAVQSEVNRQNDYPSPPPLL